MGVALTSCTVPAAGRPALILVNGLGGTPLMELYLM